VKPQQVQTLKELVQKTVAPIKGVRPAFNEYHVIKTLLLLYEKEPLGRNLLSKYLGLGVTSTRTLMKRLKELSIIYIDPVAGCLLTDYGRLLLKRVFSLVAKGGDVTEILDRSLLLYTRAFAFLLKKGVEILNRYDVTYIRDTIIKHTARASVVVYIDDGKAYIPPDKNLNEELYPSLQKLKHVLNAGDSDVIFLIFADDESRAEKAFFFSLLDLNII